MSQTCMSEGKQCQSISNSGTPVKKTGNMAVGSTLAFLALAKLSLACQDAGVSAIVLQIRPSMRSGSAGALVLHTGQAVGMKVVF